MTYNFYQYLSVRIEKNKKLLIARKNASDQSNHNSQSEPGKYQEEPMWTWIKNKQPEARENVSDQAASFLKKSQRKIKAILDCLRLCQLKIAFKPHLL